MLTNVFECAQKMLHGPLFWDRVYQNRFQASKWNGAPVNQKMERTKVCTFETVLFVNNALKFYQFFVYRSN